MFRRKKFDYRALLLSVTLISLMLFSTGSNLSSAQQLPHCTALATISDTTFGGRCNKTQLSWWHWLSSNKLSAQHLLDLVELLH
jgi:hypothetical protein